MIFRINPPVVRISFAASSRKRFDSSSVSRTVKFFRGVLVFESLMPFTSTASTESRAPARYGRPQSAECDAPPPIWFPGSTFPSCRCLLSEQNQLAVQKSERIEPSFQVAPRRRIRDVMGAFVLRHPNQQEIRSLLHGGPSVDAPPPVPSASPTRPNPAAHLRDSTGSAGVPTEPYASQRDPFATRRSSNHQAPGELRGSSRHAGISLLHLRRLKLILRERLLPPGARLEHVMFPIHPEIFQAMPVDQIPLSNVQLALVPFRNALESFGDVDLSSRMKQRPLDGVPHHSHAALAAAATMPHKNAPVRIASATSLFLHRLTRHSSFAISRSRASMSYVMTPSPPIPRDRDARPNPEYRRISTPPCATRSSRPWENLRP